MTAARFAAPKQSRAVRKMDEPPLKRAQIKGSVPPTSLTVIECGHNRKRAAELANSARHYSAKGDHPAAASSFRKALQLLRWDTSDPDCLTLWNELGMVLKYRGKYDEAEGCYQLVLRHIFKCFRGVEQQFFRATVYHNLGGVEHSRERFTRAERYARKGLELRLRCCAPDTVAVAADRAALGAILHGLCKYAESKKNYVHALRIYRREYGAGHPESAVMLNNLAAVYHATGSPGRAEYYYLAALKMKRRLLGRLHPDLAVTMNNLALFLNSQGRARAADTWMKKALQILESTLGRFHPNTVCVRHNLLRINTVELPSDSLFQAACLPLARRRVPRKTGADGETQ